MIRIILGLFFLMLGGVVLHLLPKHYVISYDGQTFRPKTLAIRQNDSITFKNNSLKKMEIALGRHEDHKNVEGFEEIIIEPKMQHAFKLQQKGVFDFHDHFNPKEVGTLDIKSEPISDLW